MQHHAEPGNRCAGRRESTSINFLIKKKRKWEADVFKKFYGYPRSSLDSQKPSESLNFLIEMIRKWEADLLKKFYGYPRSEPR